jgi:L-ascorbate metabolism protein UlaG (beta-lactamase superfamily)
MKLQNINNATTIVTAKNFKLLFDPWITGNLYQDSWSPFPKQEINNEWFKNITHIYISY